MKYYLNRGLILEQKIVELLKEYFASLDLASLYNGNCDVINIVNEHPFSQLVLSGDSAIPAGLFPSIVVTTSSDSPSEALGLNAEQLFQVTIEDIDELKTAGYDISDSTIEKLKVYLTTENSFICGVMHPIRRTEELSIEIWAENNQLKNELYEMVRLYICGGLNDDLDNLIPNRNVYAFELTLKGQRSNNYNFDFGVTLHGAQFTLSADYLIEQSILDTALGETNVNIYTEGSNGQE